MQSLLKLLFFGVFFSGIALLVYQSYKLLNQKITGSRNMWELLGFSLLLIVVNCIFFFGGLLLFIKAYVFLTSGD